MRERHYMALMRSKRYPQGRQKLISVTFYTDDPPPALRVAWALLKQGYKEWRCRLKELIVDKVI